MLQVVSGRLERKSGQVHFRCTPGNALVSWLCIFQEGYLPSDPGLLDNVAVDEHCCFERGMRAELANGEQMCLGNLD